jgi:Myb-like DNA-binding domain
LDKKQFAELLQEDTTNHYSKRTTRKLSESIANQLPGRDTLSVTRHLLKKFPVEEHPTEWTEEDDLMLRKLVTEKGKQWTVIADKMGRSADLVRLRYRDYVSIGKKRKQGRWDDEEMDKLYRVVHLLLDESDWDKGLGLKQDVVSRFVDWGTVSNKMGDRSRLQCYGKWAEVVNRQALE